MKISINKMSEIIVDKNKFGEIVRYEENVLKRPLYEADIELISAMRTEQNLKHSMGKHNCFDDPTILEYIRNLKEKISNLNELCRELDKIYNVQ